MTVMLLTKKNMKYYNNEKKGTVITERKKKRNTAFLFEIVEESKEIRLNKYCERSSVSTKVLP